MGELDIDNSNLICFVIFGGGINYRMCIEERVVSLVWIFLGRFFRKGDFWD